MTIEAALDRIREHSADTMGDGESEEVISNAEAVLGVRFPEPYRRFLQEIGYAELFGDEIYSVYDEPEDSSCLGVVQQNLGTEHLSQGYLAFLSTDIDGMFLMNIENGTIHQNSPNNEVADSFETLIEKLLGDHS